MIELSHLFCRVVRPAFLVLSVMQLAACSSQEERARSYYDRGIKLASQHDNAKAAIELRNAVRLKRDYVEAWKALAEIDESSKDWARVITDLRAIVELAPEDVVSRLKLGKLLLLAGSANEAITLADAGLDRDNHNADLHTLKAAAAFRLDDRVRAVGEAQTALARDPDNADALMVLAVERLTSGDAKGALSLLQTASAAGNKTLESNVGLQLLKIKLFTQTGDLNSVEAVLKNLAEQDPRESGYRKLLVNFYIEQHRLQDAEVELRGLVAANPSDTATALDLVRFLSVTKKAPGEARQELSNRIRAGGEAFPFQLALADMELAEGNPTGAKQLLETLVGSAGTSERIRARIALARMHLSQSSFDAAEKLAGDILRDDPRNAPALTIRAATYLEHSQPDAAVADLVNALNFEPRSVEVMSLLATAYERSGLIELADKQLADATRTSNLDPRVSLEYVEFLRRRGNLARAEDILTELVKRQPHNVRVLSALAQLRLARQNWNGAQEIAESLRRTSGSAIADPILGAALIGQGRFDAAIAALQKAYQAAPENVQLMNALVSAYLKATGPDQAMAFLKTALAKTPGSANALVLQGSVQLASGAPDRAIESFSAAVKAQPNDPIGYQALADLYLRRKDYDLAIRIVRAGIRQQPDMLGLQMTLARALEQKEDYEAAISQYQSMLDKQPGNLIIANNLAGLLLDYRTDRSSLEKAQSIAAMLRKSQIPEFKDTLCWAKYRQGDYSAAVSLCEEAAVALPDQAAIYYHLGMGYGAMGRPDKASERLKKALDLAPNGKLADAIRNALKRISEQPAPTGRPS